MKPHRLMCNTSSIGLAPLRRSSFLSRRQPLSVRNISWSRMSSATVPSTAVSDKDIARLAAKPLHILTLADLVKYGKPPLPDEALYQSANFSMSILPTRLAHRIQALRNLPFIVVTNPHITQIHNIYVHSLATLLPFAEKPIRTQDEEEQFTEVMSTLVQTHSNTIPTLARGFLQSRKYISPHNVTDFLDEHLRARIGTRLIAEQHLALHYSSQLYLRKHETSRTDDSNSTYIGIIDTALRPASIIQMCESFVAEICELNYGVRPYVVIDGEPDTKIAHIPVHLEYIMTELLKNAFRATVEKGNEREPIQITIAPSPDEDRAESSVDSSGDAPGAEDNVRAPIHSGPGVTIRIRDRGGGISPENYAKLWTYGFTTFNEREASDAGYGDDALNIISGASGGTSTLAGLGYGLPLSRAYAEYFGGGIAVQSMHGWGTDVYLHLRGVGKLN